jgi:putative ATP-dependent endonuclease of the OLD family
LRIISIKVENFRSLLKTEWINIYDLTAFIGENDSGKSACIDALKLLFDKSAKPDSEDYSLFLEEDSEEFKQANSMSIEALLELSEGEIDQIAYLVGSNKNVLHIKRQFTSDGKSSYSHFGEIPENEGFRGLWSQGTIVELKLLAEKNQVDVPKNAPKSEIITVLGSWLTKQPTTVGERSFSPTGIAMLPRVEIFSTKNGSDPESIVNNALKVLCNNEIKNEKYAGTILEIQEGIADVLREKIKDLTPFVQKYYADVQEISIIPSVNFSSGLANVPLRMTDKRGTAIFLNKKGEGKKRQVALGIYEWANEAIKTQENRGNIILIMDEPDTHMDYLSQRNLFDIISKFVSVKMQVIIATHSLNLINRMPVSKINHFFQGNNGTEVESLKSDDLELESMFLHNIGASIGLESGVIFHERCFLVVEGPTEMSALPRIFHTLFGLSLQAAGIKLVNGDNNIGARNFAKFLNSNNRSVVFILDMDCVHGSKKRAFTKQSLVQDGFDIDNQVFFVGESEFEDSFSNDFLAKIGNEHYQVSSQKTWTPEEIALLRQVDEKFSSLLGREFASSKPDIGYKIGLTLSDKDEIPDVIRRALQKALDKANTPRSRSSKANNL